MKLYENKQWISDIDEVTAGLPELAELEGKSVLVTGAAGLIGSSVIDILLRYNDTHDDTSSGKIRIYAAGRSIERMEERFGARSSEGDLVFVSYDAAKPDQSFDFSCDYVIHGAGNAYPGAILKEPVETMLANFTGIKVLLDLAKGCGTKRVLYISSSEVYGTGRSGDRPHREDEASCIDLLNPRSSYSVGKCAAETLCVSYSGEYGIGTVIVRPGHIYGPTASPLDDRVSSVWTHAAARGDNIVMKSDGSSIRSYCYCPDCASAILKVLLRGGNGRAYNISNPGSVITIREMAGYITEAAGVSLICEKAAAEEKKGFNPMSNSSLDSTSLESLGWRGIFDAGRGFSHTVSILKEMIDGSCS